MVRWWLFLLLLLRGAVGAGVSPRPVDLLCDLPQPEFYNFRFQRGDDPRWAARNFDDSAWTQITGRDLPSRSGIYWVRCRVRPSDLPSLQLRDGLLFKMVASYDLYWDGRLIGRNGHVSRERDDEGPGDVDALFQIPAELLGPGEHVLALRLSSWNTGFPTPTYGLLVSWGNFRTMLVERSRTAILSVMAVGAALVVAVVFGLMWALAGRRFPLLLFSVLFLCVALMQGLQAWRWLFEYPYNWHHPRLVTITGLIAVMAVLLPAFVMHHFEVGWKPGIYALLVALITAAWFSNPIYNLSGLAIAGVGFVMTLLLAARAVWLRKRGALCAFVGLAASVTALFLAPRDFLDHAFFISAGPAVLGLLVALVLQLRDERREARQAMLTAARLETELLKKNLQPHFLINTLATIQEVIEQEPRSAVALIDALSSEFRILARVSGEKLIPLGQELDLCQAHLRVMSRRKAARCALRVSGVDEGALVPPALFHTLIENGLTHLMPRDGKLEFELRAEQCPPVTRYVLLARGARQRTSERELGREGTGLRYIKARLEESFTGRWSFVGGPVPEGWETVIEIRQATLAVRPAPTHVAAVPQEKPA